MAHYLYQNSTINVFPQEAINIKTELEPAIYEVQASMAGYYLERISNKFSIPEKIYGDIDTFAKRIITTFASRSKQHLNTGVLFSGVKGSGKTLQAKAIANMLVKHIPVLIVNSSFGPNGLSSFLSTIDTKCCVIFDEFEKNYSSNTEDDADKTAVQNGFLTMLDGTVDSSKLFIFTCNDLTKINDYLLNRPGRIFYHFKFDSLSEDTLTMYAKENLANQDYVDDLHIIKARLNDYFTFDIMQSVIEESNRFNEAPSKFVQFMNLRSESKECKYTIDVSTSRPNIQIIKQPTEITWVDFNDMDSHNHVTIWLGMQDFADFKYQHINNESKIYDCTLYTAADLKKIDEEKKHYNDSAYSDLINTGYPCFAKVAIRIYHNDLHYYKKHLVADIDGFRLSFIPFKYTSFNNSFAF